MTTISHAKPVERFLDKAQPQKKDTLRNKAKNHNPSTMKDNFSSTINSANFKLTTIKLFEQPDKFNWAFTALKLTNLVLPKSTVSARQRQGSEATQAVAINEKSNHI